MDGLAENIMYSTVFSAGSCFVEKSLENKAFWIEK